MSKTVFSILMLCAVTLIALSGCGRGSSGTVASAPSAVYGVAAADAPLTGVVTLQDSSTPPVIQSTVTDTAGNYSFNVTGLTAPFILSVGSAGTGSIPDLFSFSTGSGRANINPFSNLSAAAAARVSDSDVLSMATSSMIQAISSRQQSVVDALKVELAPLFQVYGIAADSVNGDYEADYAGFSSLFSSVTMSVSNGVIKIANRQSGSLIFTAPVTDIAMGTFYPGNLPSAAGAAASGSACAYVYSAWGACQSDGTQTRTLLSSGPAGCTGTPVLSQTCAYTPPSPASCTYTYSAWRACQSNGTQARTLLASSPAGCTGTPVLSQTCTYTAPPTLTLTQVTATCTRCHGLTVNTTVLKSGGYTVIGRSAADWLTTVNTMVGFGASLASGTTAQDYANFLAALP